MIKRQRAGLPCALPLRAPVVSHACQQELLVSVVPPVVVLADSLARNCVAFSGRAACPPWPEIQARGARGDPGCAA